MFPYATGAMLERLGRAHGSAVAVVSVDHHITFHQQIARIRQYGRALLDLGLHRGDRVALLMHDSTALLDAYYGILWAGLTVVPLNTMASAIDNAFLINDSDSRAIVHDRATADQVSIARSDTDLQFVLCTDPDAVLDGGLNVALLADRQPAGPGAPVVGPDDRYGIFYTNGGDGRPSGAEHSHRTILSAVAGHTIELGLGTRTRFAHVAPLTHAGGMFVLPTWLAGGTNILLGRFDPDRFVHAVTTERATTTMLVPTMLYALLDSFRDGPGPLPWLSDVICGVSPVHPNRMAQALEVFGPVFTQFYGRAEAPNQITVLRKSDHADAARGIASGPLSSHGRPVPLAEARLVDDDLRDVPPGEPGELAVRGPHIAPGYWNRPEETARTMRQGWFHTGDVMTADEQGYLHLVNRKKDLVISGGFHIYPEHVEATLRAHPAVRDVAVIGVPDEKWGESVKAVVVTDPAVSVPDGELIAWVRERRGRVFAPKSVEFTDSIPLLSTGLPDKNALRARYSR